MKCNFPPENDGTRLLYKCVLTKFTPGCVIFPFSTDKFNSGVTVGVRQIMTNDD